MWKTIADWAATFFNITRELQEHRQSIRRIENRTRDLEEALKLLAQELRHSRDLDKSEREKLLLKIDAAIAKPSSSPKRRRN
jgi:predicted  nucleic acid-binding Zn-ribbon protein